MKRIITICVTLFLALNIHSQDASLYSISSFTGTSLEPAGSFGAAAIGASQANTKTTANIGFTFLYENIGYTTFGVSANGVIRLGSAIADANGLATNAVATATDCPRINPFWDDLSTGNALGYSTGGIYVATTGSAPNRICKIHFAMRNSNTIGAANLLFQVWLYETSGVIEFRYGAGANTASATIGIQGVSNWSYITKTNDLPGTSATWGQNATPDACTVWPGSGTMYQFRPCYLNGTYTINNTLPTDIYFGGTNFQNFYDAVFALNTVCWILGPVVFNVSAGQTFNELYQLPAITRTGTAVNTITFQKSGAGANPILVPIGDPWGAASEECAIKLDGVDYYTFDGIDIQSNLGNVEYGICVDNNSATNGAQNNTFKNFTIDLNTQASLYDSYGIRQNSCNNTPTSAAGANSYNKYYNFTLRDLSKHGIYMCNTANANATFPDIGCEIGTLTCTTRNSIVNLGSTNSSVTQAEAYGIYAWNQQDIKIFNTDVSAISGKQQQTCGIYLHNGTGNCSIYNNKVSDITAINSSTASWVNVYGIRCQLRTGTGNRNVKVYNNFISNIRHSYSGSATGSIYVFGLEVGNPSATSTTGGTQSYDVHNNSVSIGQGLSPTYSNTCFALSNNFHVYRVRGNIFANFTSIQASSAKHTCISVTNAGLGAAGTAFDYNDYWVPNGVGVSGATGQMSMTYYNTLANWITFTTGTLDDNSIAIDPLFVNNNTDLHVSATGLDAVAGFTTETWVSNDIDCEIRTSLTPNDIGADAFGISCIPTAPIIGTITQPTCTVVTGSVALSGLPSTGTWTLTASPGGATTTGSGTTGTFSGLSANTYTFTVTNASGCTSVASLNAVINAQPTAPTAPAIGTITQPTCTVVTGSVALSGLPSTGTWTLTASPGGATTTGSGTTGTFSGLSANTYTFTVTNASGCTSVASLNAVINAQPTTPTAPIIGTITQPTCTVATGSVALSGLPSTGTWTLTASPGGTTTTGSGTTGTFSGLSANTYTFTVTNASGCTSVASLNAVINAQPTTPTAPIIGTITQPTCTVATGSVALSGLPSTGTWTVTALPGGATTTGSGTTGTFSGLSANTYTFTVTNASGCTSVASLNAVINAQPTTPTTPIIGTITQPTCTVATGSVALSGLPSTGTWTLTASPGGATTTGSGTTGTFSGLSANTYTFTVTNASGCTSVASLNAVINAQPTTPTAPAIGTITQPTCTVATGSVALSGLPSTGTWTLTASPGGATTTGSGTTGTFSGLSANTYTFTVTNASGCTSVASLNAVINAQPTAPTAPAIGTITQPTCTVATGSVALSGLPSTGTWTLTASPGGATTTGSGTTGTFSGLSANTYTFTVTNASGCTSVASLNAVINAQPTTPTAPIIGTITQPTCTVATGSVALSGLPSTGTWTVTALPGGATTTGSGTTGTFSGLSANTYTFTVTNASGCTSVASLNAVINAQPTTPTTPIIGTITQPTCTVATGSVALSGLPSTGTWTLTASPGGATTTGSGTTGTFSGLSANTYTFTVTNASGCTSVASLNAVINAQPTTPTAPAIGTITQPTCTVATGSVALSGLPSTGTWTLTASPGGATTTGSGTTGTFSGLSANTYTFTVTNASGCTSVASLNAVINAQPTAPTAPAIGTITQPTCTVATGSVALSGLPSTGTWTLTASPGGATTTGSGTTGTFSGLSANTYTFTVTNASGCTSVASLNAVINAQPTTPTAPIIGTITQPTCTVATGSVALSGLPSTGTWTLTASPGGASTTGSGTTGTFSGLSANTYTFTVTNASGCTSVASLNAVINAQPISPNVPLISTTSATCLANGIATISNYDETVIYDFTPIGPVIGTGGLISNMAIGTTYLITANNGTCISTTSSPFSIASQLSTPVISISLINPSGCNLNNGSILVSGSGTGILNWSGSASGTTNSVSLNYTISTLGAGNYNVYFVDGTSGCQSATVSTTLINPAAPVINNPGSLTACDSYTLPSISGTFLSGSQAYYSNSQTNGGTVITGPITSTQTVYIYDVNGACSDEESFIVTINNTPVITNFGPQVACVSYSLPSIVGSNLSGNQSYYSNSQTNSGTVITGPITSTQTVYIYDTNGACSDEESFIVTINNTPVITNFGPQVACVSYSLPSIVGSNLSGNQSYYSNSQTNSGTVITGPITSTQTVYIYDTNGACSDEESFLVTINSEPTLVSFTGGSTYCEGDVITDLKATVNGSSVFTLYYSINGITQIPITGSTSSFNLGSVAGIYVLDSLADANCLNNSISASQTITINPIPVAPIAEIDTTYCSNSTPNNLTASGIGTFTWYDNSNNVLGTGSTYTPTMNVGTTTYLVSQSVIGCEGPTASVLITVKECGVIVPTAFTPDNDNANDFWLLEKIDEIYPNNVVTIYNRWGNLIFQSKAGQYELEPWDGTYKDEIMPVGSYYFIIEYNDGFTEKINGVVSIIR